MSCGCAEPTESMNLARLEGLEPPTLCFEGRPRGPAVRLATLYNLAISAALRPNALRQVLRAAAPCPRTRVGFRLAQHEMPSLPGFIF